MMFDNWGGKDDFELHKNKIQIINSLLTGIDSF